MKRLTIIASCLFILLVAGGCASNYHPIRPEKLNYSSNTLIHDGISLTYRYDVLRENRNKKYAKKEMKAGMKVVSLKLVNYSDHSFTIGQDLVFYTGQNQLQLSDPASVHHILKQNVAGYLAYLLLSPLKFYVTTPTRVTYYRLGLIFGPGIAFGNMAMAGTSNADLKRELVKYDLRNATLNPGDTLFGIAGFMHAGFDPLDFRIREREEGANNQRK